MNYNIKLLIAYDGTHYKGWQHSIEAALKERLEKIFQHPIKLQAASRTDAGVHAYGQVANFYTNKLLDLQRLKCSLNQLMPKDIVIREIELAPENFHPTLDAIGKEYRYYICNSSFQLPHHRFYSWHVYQELDFDSILKGTQIFGGEHDFSSFCNEGSNSAYEHYIRKIDSLEMVKIEKNRYCFIIKGNNFLYKMVRNIVGTLIDVGRKKIPWQSISQILEEKNRIYAGVSAPAHGLFLQEVFYK